MSGRTVVTTHRADEDIDDILKHYLDQGAEQAALNFIDALERAQELMSEFPQTGSARLGAEVDIPGMRSMSLRQFPYLVFYTDDVDYVRIHRVLHTARDIPLTLRDG